MNKIFFAIFMITLAFQSSAKAAPVIDVSKSDALAVDIGGDGVVNPGDTIRYNVTIANTGDMSGTGVQFADVIDTNTTLVPNSLNTSPIAFEDMYVSTDGAIGNTTLSANSAGGVLKNDKDADSDILTVTEVKSTTSVATATPATITTDQNGDVTLNSDGSFTYEPPAGFTGTDGFQYTINDGNGGTDMGMVMIGITDRVWYVDNTVAPGGDGTLSSPFDNLASAETAATSAGDIIFIFKGDGTNTKQNTGITLLMGQSLIGQGVDLVVDGVTIVSATSPSPVITNTTGDGVVLAQNNTIAGVNIGNTPVAGTGIKGSSYGLLTIADVSISTNGGPGIDLDTGTLEGSLNSVSSVNSSTEGIKLVNTTVTSSFTFSSVTVNAPANNGISLQTNTGTFNFNSISITTNGSNGFVASSSGTINITGSNNTINTTSGTALNILNTTIGASGLTFKSIAVNGGTNGIVLNNTGFSGGLTVTGVGTTSGTGGTIQNTTNDALALTSVTGLTLKNMIIGDSTATIGQSKDATNNIGGDGISLTNVDNVDLNNLKIARTNNHGIDGTGVTNFAMTDCEVLNAGNANDEHGIDFGGVGSNNLDGTVTITNSTIDASANHGLFIQNSSGTLNMTISGTQFSGTANTPSMQNGEDGLQLDARGTAVITALINNSCTFSGLESDGIMGVTNENSGATLNVTVDGNTFTGFNNGAPNMRSDNAVEFNATGTTTLRYTINNNTMNSSSNHAILLGSNDNSTVHGIVSSNNITASLFGRGISAPLIADDNSTVRLSVDDNDIAGHNLDAMFFNVNNTAELDISITNNRAPNQPGDTTTFENLTVQASSTSTLCARIGDDGIGPDNEGNTIALGGANAFGPGFPADSIAFFRLNSSSVTLEQGSSASAVATTVLSDNNPTTTSVLAFGTIGVVSNGSCDLPVFTPLP